MPELTHEIMDLSSSDSSDALISLGANGVLKGIHSMNGHSHLVGWAMTVNVSTTGKGKMALKDGVMEASQKADNGSVLVITTDNDEFSILGGFTSYIAQSCGIAGAIVCGKYRDSEEIEKRKFPVFAQETTPLIASHGLSVLSIGSSVEYRGILISRRDLVVADSDGVTIIPQHLLNEVINLARKKREQESESIEKFNEEILKEINKKL